MAAATCACTLLPFRILLHHSCQCHSSDPNPPPAISCRIIRTIRMQQWKWPACDSYARKRSKPVVTFVNSPFTSDLRTRALENCSTSNELVRSLQPGSLESSNGITAGVTIKLFSWAMFCPGSLPRWRLYTNQTRLQSFKETMSYRLYIYIVAHQAAAAS